MTTAVTEPVAIAIGTPITDVAQMTALPVGAVICCQRTGDEYRKVGDGEWASSYFGEVNDEHFALDGRNVVTSMPDDETPVNEPTPFSYEVGKVVSTPAEMRGLPIGSVLDSPRSDRTWTRTSAGFVRNDGHVVRVDRMRARGLTIQSLPTDDHLSETPCVTETLAKFKQRFRATCYGHAWRAGVSTSPLDAAMEILDVPKTEPHIGGFITTHDGRIGGLPDGCLIVHGDDPSNWLGYGMYGVERGLPIRLLGGVEADRGIPLFVIKSGNDLDGEPDCFTPEEGKDYIDEVLAFKKQAWQIGVEAKRDNDWCGDYEQAMSACGIHDGIANITRADYVSAEECAELPEGTVLRTAYPTVGSATALYRRDDSSGNPARTVRIGGEASGSWAKLMLVVHRPPATMCIRIASHVELDLMPTGTTIASFHGSDTFTRRDDGTWGRDAYDRHYGYSTGQLPIGSYSYLSIP